MGSDAHLAFRDGKLLVTLSGDWSIHAPNPSVHDILLTQTYQTADIFCLEVNSEGIGRWDSSLVNFIKQLSDRHPNAELRHALPNGIVALLDLACAVPQIVSTSPAEASWLSNLVTWVSPFSRSEQVGLGVMQFMAFIGELVIAAAKALVGQARMRMTDLLQFCYQTGPNALPIISLSSVLVGVILGYLGAVQLQQFGAGIYVANLVTVGVLREMGALMTAIIIAGRTGAAYAAQLGTMQVNEEVDAIEILGISPMEFLILPRVIAVLIMVPLLTLYADILGIIGGGIVAGGLGISPLQYWTQLQESLMMSHVIVGLLKGLLFGLLIGIAGCRAGMQAARNSEGVGSATTNAVVTALIYLVVADAAINIVCQWLEI